MAIKISHLASLLFLVLSFLSLEWDFSLPCVRPIKLSRQAVAALMLF